MNIIVSALKSRTVWSQIIGFAALAIGQSKFAGIDLGAAADNAANLVTAAAFIAGIFFRVNAKTAIVPNNVSGVDPSKLPPF